MSSVTGSVRVWLRVEGLAVLASAVLLYREQGRSWLLFAVLFFAPDLSMLGYVRGRRIGASVYNVAHSYVLPLALLVAGAFAGTRTATGYALIWAAHIGFDRMLGYGLKYPSAFAATHLGTLTGRMRSGIESNYL